MKSIVMPSKALVLSLLAISFSGCGSPPEPKSRYRNVVLIGVDTLRPDHLGFGGSKFETSPTLDGFAKNAMVFDQAYSTASWTLPAFASLLTGLDPAEHGAGIMLRHTGEREWDEERVGLRQRTIMDPSVQTLAERLSDEGFATYGVAQSPNLAGAYGFERGFDAYENVSDGRRRANGSVDLALELLDRELDRPTFMFLHLIDPHLTYDAPEPATGVFTGDIDAGLSLPVANIGNLRDEYINYSPIQRDFVSAAYDEEILFTDQQINRFLNGLRERGMDKNTLIILTSDHGEEFFEHGGFEHGHSMYQEVIQVPFLVWGKGITGGLDSTPVSIADAAPTILDALGLEAGEPGFGKSLWPQIDAGAVGMMDRMIVAAGTLYGPEKRMAIVWPYKLIQLPGKKVLELYNLESDPGETKDVSNANRVLTWEMAEELDRRMYSIAHGPQGAGAEIDASMKSGLEELGYTDGGEEADAGSE
ncbi:MAG: arylsulfatase A-like enzyme [Planctomycetota bacterium]|jgi:arylsulfatase A-like enzyme